MKQCSYCNINLSSIPTKEKANHVRWCGDKRDDTHKYLVYCSCICCKQTLPTSGITLHFESKHSNKYIRNCVTCNAPIMKNKFCSRSCAAITNGKLYPKRKKRDASATITKPRIKSAVRTIKYNAKESVQYTKVQQCHICLKYHSLLGATCSINCKKKLLSIRVRERIDAGWNPQENRNRAIPSFLEKSFESWLLDNKITNYIKNKTFRCGEKIYFGDFYFPELSLLIELDGQQHIANTAYDKNRDDLILSAHGIYTYRISYKEYMNKSKIDIVVAMLLEP